MLKKFQLQVSVVETLGIGLQPSRSLQRDILAKRGFAW
jgi:hypothetical protein